MALKIRQRKKKEEKQHPDYLLGAERTWADDERERTKGSFRRNFVAILAVIVVITVILIVSAVSGVIDITNPEQQITAADTFAVTQYEQQQMQQDSKQFAQGILVYSYCSDQETAFSGKNAALKVMAQNTDSYKSVMNLQQVNPVIDPESLVPVVTEPKMQTNTQVYVDTVTFVFSGVVADSSDKTDSEDGSFVDGGYNISTTFSRTVDTTTNEQVWVISDCSIAAK